MDFAIRNLSVLAYAQGFTLWHYKAAGLTLDRTQRAGFFNSAADMIGTGDMMLVSAADGGCVLFVAQASEAGGIATAKLA
jgi:hypothetical protein